MIHFFGWFPWEIRNISYSRIAGIFSLTAILSGFVSYLELSVYTLQIIPLAVGLLSTIYFSDDDLRDIYRSTPVGLGTVILRREFIMLIISSIVAVIIFLQSIFSEDRVNISSGTIFLECFALIGISGFGAKITNSSSATSSFVISYWIFVGMFGRSLFFTPVLEYLFHISVGFIFMLLSRCISGEMIEK